MIFQTLIRVENSTLDSFKRAVYVAKKEFIFGALTHKNGNVTQAARTLGIDRSNLSRLIRHLNICRCGYEVCLCGERGEK